MTRIQDAERRVVLLTKRDLAAVIGRIAAMLIVIVALMPACPALGSGLGITAESAILMDVRTGEILYSKDIHRRMEPASTTKILTAIVAIERGGMNDRLTVSENASHIEGSSIWLAEGEQHTLSDILHGLLLSSGNDAAVTIAENLAGNEAQFVRWMNEKARQLGAVDSNFMNTNGLPDPGHRTSVHDMALVSRYALQLPALAQIVRTRRHVMPWPEHEWDRALINHNKLLWRYEGADGVKTGYTRSAGHCLVASATRNGQQLLAVVFRSRNTYNDCAELFDWGFQNFALQMVARRNDAYASLIVDEGVDGIVQVVPSADLALLLTRSQEGRFSVDMEMPARMEAPVWRLQKVGKLVARVGDEVLGEVDLVAAKDVPRKTLLFKFFSWLRSLFGAE